MTMDRNSAGPRQQLPNFLQCKAMIVNWLYIGSFALPFSGIAGVIVAHVWRNEAMRDAEHCIAGHDDWMISHYTYHIRTFWIGLVAMIIGFVLTFIVIGIFVLLAVAVWTVVRCVMSIQRCQYGEEMPDPMTLLW